MANYRAVSGGVWSALARWQDDAGGSYVNSTVLPGVNDVVYANNFTVNIDIDIAVLELRTTAGTNVTTGGIFDYTTTMNSVTANVFSGAQVCLRNQTNQVKTFIGNAVAGASQNAINVNNGGLIMTGNATGGSGFGIYGVFIQGGASFVLNGNSNAGQSSAGIALGSGTATITGSCIGSNINATTGAICQSGTMTVTTSQAGTNGAGVERSGGTLIVTNAFYGSSGVSPTIGLTLFSNTGGSVKITRQNLTTTTLVDPAAGFPATGDVRSGTTYASGTLTGTLAVPPAGAVSLGVPVDNTTGTATLSAQDFFTAIANSADPIAERLRNVSTVATTAATVAAFDV
jgi:hypothetical protein